MLFDGNEDELEALNSRKKTGTPGKMSLKRRHRYLPFIDVGEGNQGFLRDRDRELVGKIALDWGFFSVRVVDLHRQVVHIDSPFAMEIVELFDFIC
jgi:hypothetical protein